VSLKRLLVVCLAVAASIVFVPGASAGNFDEQRMGCTGEDPAVCPAGTTNQSYSLQLYLLGDEDLGCAVFSVSSGSLPPGLSLASEGVISGTPTQAGNFDLYLTVTYNKESTCNKPASDDRFVIPINPGAPVPPPLPRLTIGPEFVSPGTVGTPYMAAMTANLPDSKTWSIVAGSLPPGLVIGASDGLISGTPTVAGSYAFTVQAVIDGARSDTKALTIVVRDPLTITGPTDPALEVGVRYLTALKGNGGLRTYKWALTAGAMPPGLTFFPGGAITGRPTTAGEFEFTVTLTDSEGRTTTYDGSLTVAARLAVATTQLTGRAGRFFGKKVVTFGGVGPVSWRLKRGPLPRGIKFDRFTGTFFGTPTRSGIWAISVEVVDSLRVKSTAIITITVRSQLKLRNRR
jgi:hypothetical protein